MTVELAIGGLVFVVICALIMKRRVSIKVTKKGASFRIDAPL